MKAQAVSKKVENMMAMDAKKAWRFVNKVLSPQWRDGLNLCFDLLPCGAAFSFKADSSVG
jgi:hypothetical protein